MWLLLRAVKIVLRWMRGETGVVHAFAAGLYAFASIQNAAPIWEQQHNAKHH